MNVRELVSRVLETVNGNQAELARRLGRSETTISRWANGKTGIDYESALRIARMTKLSPREVLESAGLDADLFPAPPPGQPDLKRASRQQQVEEWLMAVGPAYEQYFWDHLKVQGDTAAAFIRNLSTAVSGATDAAVSDAPDERAKRGRRPRNGGKGPLSRTQRAANGVLDVWPASALRGLAGAGLRHVRLTAASAPA